jgi:MFS superfamily sulfate permease-like transporter
VVGFIDDGFPPMFFDFAFGDFFQLLSSAIVISFVGFMESIAISKRIAARRKYVATPPLSTMQYRSMQKTLGPADL